MARKCTDVYGEPTIIVKGNCVARVYSPILTDEERERRMNEIKKATAQIMTNYFINKKLKEQAEQTKEE